MGTQATFKSEVLAGVAIPCDKCETPVCRLVGSTLVIEARHHGQKHTTVIPIDRLQLMVKQQKELALT